MKAILSCLLALALAAGLTSTAAAESIPPATPDSTEEPADLESKDDDRTEVRRFDPSFSSKRVTEDYDLTRVSEWNRFLRENGVPNNALDQLARQQGHGGVPDLLKSLAASFDARPEADTRQAMTIEDGTLTFNETVADSALEFVQTMTFTDIGAAQEDVCLFEPLGPERGVQGDHVVMEVVSIDTQNCTREVFSAEYIPSSKVLDEVDLPVDDGYLPDPSDRSLVSPFFSCNGLLAGPTLFQPNQPSPPGESRRYYKQSFVDPICITITSNTLNMRWKNAADPAKVHLMKATTVESFLYTDLGEQWTTLTRTNVPGWSNQVWAVAPKAETVFTRRESQFPENLLVLSLAAGYNYFLTVLSTCGFDLSDTTFTSTQRLYPKRNGGWSASGSGLVTGGCSSLVHERVWHGSGSYAR